MINKKIASELAVGIVVLVALVVGGIFWMENKDKKLVDDVVQLTDEERETIRLKTLIDKDILEREKISKEEDVEYKEWQKSVCDKEIKQCENGWQVTKSVSNCEYVQCPDNYDASKWLTYRSVEFDFSFKYPNNWKITKSSWRERPGVTFLEMVPAEGGTRGLRYTLAISKLNGEYEKDPEDWFKSYYSMGVNPERKERKFAVDSNNFYLSDEIKDSYIDKYYIVNHKGLFLFFSFRIKDESSDKSDLHYSLFEYEPQYEAMVNSLEFQK